MKSNENGRHWALGRQSLTGIALYKGEVNRILFLHLSKKEESRLLYYIYQVRKKWLSQTKIETLGRYPEKDSVFDPFY